VSEILNRLKQAEAERERVIAERRRHEAEADAALAEREREEQARMLQQAERPVARQPARAQPPQSAPRASQEPTPQQRSRLAAGVAIGAAMAVVFWVGTLVPQQQPEPVVKAPPVPAVRPITPAKAPPPALFRMDQDLDAFASRVKDPP
jgi:hypothetical protein